MSWPTWLALTGFATLVRAFAWGAKRHYAKHDAEIERREDEPGECDRAHRTERTTAMTDSDG
jgi:hypothetical protein